MPVRRAIFTKVVLSAKRCPETKMSQCVDHLCNVLIIGVICPIQYFERELQVGLLAHLKHYLIISFFPLKGGLSVGLLQICVLASMPVSIVDYLQPALAVRYYLASNFAQALSFFHLHRLLPASTTSSMSTDGIIEAAHACSSNHLAPACPSLPGEGPKTLHLAPTASTPPPCPATSTRATPDRPPQGSPPQPPPLASAGSWDPRRRILLTRAPHRSLLWEPPPGRASCRLHTPHHPACHCHNFSTPAMSSWTATASSR